MAVPLPSRRGWRFRRPVGVPALLAGVVACVLAAGYWAPAFRVLEATGFGDWQMVHHNWEVGFVAWTRHHELPLVDAYHCGGVTMVGNPESQLYSPLFLLAFLVGPTLATKLFVVLHTAAALLGSVHYARRVANLSWPASVLVAVVFAGSGFFAWHLAGGHATFAPFAFLPWLHLALRRGETEPRAVLVGGLLLALTIAEGGTYPFPYMLVSLGVAGLVRILADRRLAWPVVRAGLGMTLIGLLAAAHRILPIRETLARFPRTIESVDVSSIEDVWTMLTARDHAWAVPGHEFVWPEYGTYVGVVVLGLAGLGLLRGTGRRFRALTTEHLIGGLVATLLILGNASPLHPWVLLRELPVFDSLRVPSRFAVVLTFHLAVLAGLGLDVLDARLRRGLRRAASLVLASLLVVGITTDLVIVTRPIVDRWDGLPIDTGFVAETLTYRPPSEYGWRYASYPRRNESSTACYVGGMNWVVSPAIRLGDRPQAWTEGGAGTVVLADRSPSRFVLEVELPHPDRVRVNRNYDPDFVTDVGRVVEADGLLAVEAPAGRSRITLRFAPPSLVPGFVVSVLTLVACWLAWRRIPRWGRLAFADDGLSAGRVSPYPRSDARDLRDDPGDRSP